MTYSSVGGFGNGEPKQSKLLITPETGSAWLDMLKQAQLAQQQQPSIATFVEQPQPAGPQPTYPPQPAPPQYYPPAGPDYEKMAMIVGGVALLGAVAYFLLAEKKKPMAANRKRRKRRRRKASGRPYRSNKAKPKKSIVRGKRKRGARRRRKVRRNNGYSPFPIGK